MTTQDTRTAVEEFVSDAILGGWKGWDETDQEWFYDMYHRYGTQWCNDLKNSRILLDPLAWQAVGKTRGWKDKDVYEHDAAHDADWDRFMQPGWNYKMHRFIDHLADGDSIEEALGKLK